ncbi:flagellar basal-body rod protein FlgG [Burkholderia oklahomensis]|uniref:Flagellar basal-body rod protein FlgG n=1 Tax=Burkholderia oklahomensis TaxID=342113 RepID=A0AAI8FQM5_9BURK|nr:flagellar basal-body rod protein FlgG [Burkholderia oklahomensis]AIO69841.1 flagellar basal-body rod protein FlgG [Burkholderia oklahomensis]AJX34936.1 flagellar basal-body rod protein FlgG [Burkholderia oklahomensis C6786]MBI0363920.1 flagellar basal-body rod protein FlgG [Burkholderia oklahomensis]MDN7675482.1 flagellar basal-body rod protein FlgG [Burkholderia oklahomensis]QPS41409.1 flagellar basal-body rod protein FlgG [Burkholderia oklahomensis]
MNQAMWISKTGLQAQDARLQAIANNLANANTVGFKRDRMVFEDLFYRIERQPGAQLDQNNAAPLGVQLGTGTRLVGTQKVFTDGSVQTTGQALDVAIVGKGFLQMQLANGETGYTRAGQLTKNAEGLLTNAQGLPLQPEIAIPENATEIVIGENGVVAVKTPGASELTEVGQVQLADFVNPAGLLSIGDNLYMETVASGPPNEGDPGTDAFGKIKQGSLEASNVKVVDEMVEMIAAQRTYEMNTKVLSAADSMLQYLAQAAR